MARQKASPVTGLLFADVGRRSLTNAVFLIGAYMIVRHNTSSAEGSDTFRSLPPTNQTEPYRDATYSETDFALELIDCWRGLEKGVQHGWVRYAGSDPMWGDIDADEYRHYDNPANGDLQEVVPGKVVALKGPVATPDDAPY